MNLSSITNLFSQGLPAAQSAVQAGLTSTTGTAPATGQASDSSQLSPFAQILSTLQQLQQTNPTEYQQVTGQIATNLQNAAQTAQQAGNSAQASGLSQLATDFGNASKTGQLPNVPDLAAALQGGGHHHGHHVHSGSASDLFQQSDSETSSAPNSLNPAALILQTLNSAGTTSGSLVG